MQATEDPLVEKILCDLENAIKKNTEICEFEIIQTEANRNKSPVIRVGVHLGLESWCIKQVYSYIHRQIIAARQYKSKHKITHDVVRFNRLLLGGLLLNAELSTCWNMRREFVIDNSLDIRNELRISKLVLSIKPKSNEAFSYRKWILQRVLKLQSLDQTHMNSLIRQEMEVASKAAEKCNNNYHAWNYKLWIMQYIAPMMPMAYETLVNHQLEYSEINMTRAVSDNSVFHYRQQIINSFKKFEVELDEKYVHKFKAFIKQNVTCKDLDKYSWTDILIIVLGKPPKQKCDAHTFNCLSNTITLLIHELMLISELNTIFSCHESIWYHRRFVLAQLLTILCDYYDVKQEKAMIFENILHNVRKDIEEDSGKNIIDIHITNVPKKFPSILESVLLYKAIIENEKKELECCSMDLEQLRFVERHKKWIIINIGLPLLD